MNTNPPKRIDLTTGTFESNGTKYYIQPTEMHYERLVLFNQLKPKVMNGMALEECLEWVFKMWAMVRNPDPQKSTLAVYGDLVLEFDRFCKEAQGKRPTDVAKMNIDTYMEFCTYFVTVEGEDLSTYDKVLAHKKIEDWKTDMYPPDFFLLVWQRLKSLTEEQQSFMQRLGIA